MIFIDTVQNVFMKFAFAFKSSAIFYLSYTQDIIHSLLNINPIDLLVLIVFKQTGKLDILIPAISIITHIKIHCI